eukprot:233702-Pelagomonas_calceolata.AAC.2
MVSQTESLHMVPVTPYDNAKKGAQHQGRRTRSATPKPSTKERTQYVVPSTSARKTSQRKQQKGAAAPQPSPPKDIAQQGGLYFDMDGRPMFVEMKPAAFYGECAANDGDVRRVHHLNCQLLFPLMTLRKPAFPLPDTLA